MKEEKKKIGRLLRAARTERGVPLEKASKDTKITQKYLKAIEDEQFSFIPGEVVLKGFIRIYADYLGVESKVLITELSKKPKKEPVIEEVKPAAVKKQADLKPYIKVLLMAVSAVIAAAFIVVLLRSVVLVTIRQVDKASLGKPAAVKSAQGKIEVQAQFLQKTWTLVLSDGKLVFKDIVPAGRTITWKANNKLLIKAGNAAGIRLISGGKVVMDPGSPGQVVTKEFTFQ